MTDHYSDADLLSLRSLPVPPEVARVQGCTCGGLDWHAEGCGLFSVDKEQAAEAVAAAHRRLREHTDGLNDRLRTLIAAAQPDLGSST